MQKKTAAKKLPTIAQESPLSSAKRVAKARAFSARGSSPRSLPVSRAGTGKVAMADRSKGRKTEAPVRLPKKPAAAPVPVRTAPLRPVDEERPVPVRSVPPVLKAVAAPVQAPVSTTRLQSVLRAIASAIPTIAVFCGALIVSVAAALILLPSSSLVALKTMLGIPALASSVSAFLHWSIGPIAANLIEITRADTLTKIASDPIIVRPVQLAGRSLALLGAAIAILGGIGTYLTQRKEPQETTKAAQ